MQSNIAEFKQILERVQSEDDIEKCNDFDIDSAKKHMEIIQDYFNQLAISKYNVVKL